MEEESNFTKAAIIVFLIIGIVIILFYGKPILLPLAFAAILAMLIKPLYKKLKKWGIPNFSAILISSTSIVIVIGFITLLVGIQASQIANDWPEMEKKLEKLTDNGKNYLQTTFNLKPERQKQMIENFKRSLINQIGSVFNTIGETLANMLLIFVYIILLLSQKDRLKKFLHKITEKRQKTENSLEKISEVGTKYLQGKLTLILILGVIYTISFLIAGVKYAILIAVLTAVLSIIPYLGNLMGGSVAALLTLIASGSTEAIWVIVIISLAQVIESYVLEPMIVGDKIDLNPLAAVVCAVGFSFIWGIGGAILALPITGIVKIIFDYTKGLEPLGYLLGDN